MTHSWSAAWVILATILSSVVVASGENPGVIVASLVVTGLAITVAFQLRKLDGPRVRVQRLPRRMTEQDLAEIETAANSGEAVPDA